MQTVDMPCFDKILSSLLKELKYFFSKLAADQERKKVQGLPDAGMTTETAGLAHRTHVRLGRLPATCVRTRTPLSVSFENIPKTGQSADNARKR